MIEENALPRGSCSAVGLLIRAILILINIAISLLTLLGIWGTSLLSREGMFCFLLQGMMPFLFWANIAFAIYWIIRKRIFSVSFLLTVGALLVVAPKMVNVSLDAKESGEESFRVATFNIRALRHDGRRSSLLELASWVEKNNPDIVCFQEYVRYDTPGVTNLTGLLSEYKYVVENITSQAYSMSHGSAIFSKYPIVGYDTLCFNSPINNAIICDIRVDDDTLRVVNAHLQTTQLNSNTQKLKKSLSIGDSHRTNTEIENLFGRLKYNNDLRVGQARRIRQAVDGVKHPVIVAGDLNDSPFSYTYDILSDGMGDSFRDSGLAYGYTYRGLLKSLRIDYIFYKGLKGVSYDSPYNQISDHNPVIADFSLDL